MTERTGRTAAFTVWLDELENASRAFLWTPAAGYELVRDGQWRIEAELANPFGEVPVVEFTSRPRTGGAAKSELADAIDIQDRINETIFARVVATLFAAWRQRYAIGLGIDEDENGQPIPPFRPGADRLWIAEEPSVTFGEFSESNLSNFIGAEEADVAHFAAITKTPPNYLTGALVNVSADAIRAAEAGLIAKVRRHQLHFGEAFETLLRLALGRADAGAASTSEVLWRDPENRSEAERVDALTKLSSIGVPEEALWERVPGVTPQEVARWRGLKRRQRLTAPPTVVVPQTPPQAPPPPAAESQPSAPDAQ